MTFALALAALLLLGAQPQLAAGFKAHEFKTCDKAHFCKRNRNREPGTSTLVLRSGEINPSGKFVGIIRNKAPGKGKVALFLEITAYSDSTVRMKVNEDASRNRFEVPDVLEPGLESKAVPLSVISGSAVEGDVAPVHLSFGEGRRAVLAKDPFAVHVYRGDDLLMSFNGKGLFEFEHRRNKTEPPAAAGEAAQAEGAKAEGAGAAAEGGENILEQAVEGEGEAKSDGGAEGEGEAEEAEAEEGEIIGHDAEDESWEETFKGHFDSKPRGPEAISFDVTFHGAQNVYGIPERATSLSLRPTKGPGVHSEPYRLYNLDVFEYLHESPFGLYGSIPMMLAHSAARTTGVFWLNAAEMWIDVLAKPENATTPEVTTYWIAESGILDLFFFLGPSPAGVVRQYTAVTGTTAMPQLFAVAYQQCRWNYKDEADALAVDAGFDEHDIPYDVLWLDIEHTDGKRYMTWDSTHFPHPADMQNKFAAKGRRMVTIVDPHVKRDDGYSLHKEATNKGYYVKDSSGKDYDGWCWPGSSSYLDVLSPEIRAWWAGKFAYSSYGGSTPNLYIWNDMNEPSVFNGPEVTMPKDNLHFGGVEHRDVHNAYGYYYHLATAEGLKIRNGPANLDRPFVLSRAIFAGSQRVGPIWTGDNTADWQHLRVSIPMLLSLGLAGMGFSGADVGGFFGNPNAELLLRWYQMGVFYPFFRAHAHLDTKRREPWLFGEPYTSHIREAVRTRYALLPYLYTQFRTAFTAGTPPMRPLWFEFPADPRLFSHQDSFLLGPSVLVHPVTVEGATSVKVLFPGSEFWYDLKTGQPHASGERELPVALDTMPVFQRAGSIVPRKDRARRSSTQMEKDPYTLVIALNSTMGAEGELYIDDGKSYAYEKGAFIHRRFLFSNGVLRSLPHPDDVAASHSLGAQRQAFETPCVVERVVVFGLPADKLARSREAVVEGTGVRLEEEVGPAWLRPGVPSSVLVVRAPRVPIASDWSIKIFDP
ncbi:hypothetical protein CLOM_g1878 [Closterium sp. NIES-68]|nr:hypothetical protein CLOM_g22962 [Closterium sp. NIES-68]GJP42293.1 hypothetical protein CLOM_g1878 [Closterium sp. NIES-68]GJP84505.1 hypothetical protein CLOP_g14568 [Closterium sp. NIES-67]